MIYFFIEPGDETGWYEKLGKTLLAWKSLGPVGNIMKREELDYENDRGTLQRSNGK